jgi:beta-galactosidase
MYFQWRRGRGGAEKFHGAVVEHGGRTDTRVFREVTELGAELQRLGAATLGAPTPSRVAVLFDWDNWWAIEGAIGPINPKDYVGTVRKHYNALWRRNVPIDIIFSDSDLSPYDLVIAPTLHMVKPPVAARVEAFVARGGTFVTTYFSGVVDENDLAFEGYPGPLSNVLGIWVEEIDALYADQANQIVMADNGERYTCAQLCDIVHAEGAKVLATYGDDFYAGMPALTANTFGEGLACYIASDPEDRFLDDFYGRLLLNHGIVAPLDVPAGVELAVRQVEQRSLYFMLNHSPAAQQVNLPDGRRFHEHLSAQTVSGTLLLPGYGVAILEA